MLSFNRRQMIAGICTLPLISIDKIKLNKEINIGDTIRCVGNIPNFTNPEQSGKVVKILETNEYIKQFLIPNKVKIREWMKNASKIAFVEFNKPIELANFSSYYVTQFATSIDHLELI